MIHEDSTSVKLLHMRYIGGVDRLIERYKVYMERMCDYNKEHDLGYQYLMKVEEIRKKWEGVKSSSKKLDW